MLTKVNKSNIKPPQYREYYIPESILQDYYQQLDNVLL